MGYLKIPWGWRRRFKFCSNKIYALYSTTKPIHLKVKLIYLLDLFIE